MKALGILDVMPWGKYKGELIGTVCEDDPGYLVWALEATSLELDEQPTEYLKECR